VFDAILPPARNERISKDRIQGMIWHWLVALGAMGAATPDDPVAQARSVAVEERSVAELQAMMTRGVMGVTENASEQESNAKFISVDES